MPSERNFYHDFSRELRLEQWEIRRREGELFQLECSVSPEAGNWLFLFPCRKQFNPYNPELRRIGIDGQSFSPQKDGKPFYVHPDFLRRGIATVATGKPIRLELDLRCSGEDPRTFLYCSLAQAEAAVKKEAGKHMSVPLPPEPEFPEKNELSSDGFEPGPGGEKAPGRFGFTKGDGLLDCAMSSFGIVDKMYLCGHPRYRKNYKWSYSTLPEPELFRGSHFPAEQSISGDEIEVNQLSVRWSSTAGSYRTTCSYSLGTPGIVTESSAPFARISALEFAGNYRNAMIVRRGKAESVPLEDTHWQEMERNFILLHGATEFPDLPLLILLSRPPEKVEIRRDPASGRLAELLFHGVSRIITSTPFGIESFDPGQTLEEPFLKRALELCLFQSRAQLAFPIRCREYFKLDEAAGKVEIRQQFEYRIFSDAWETRPLKCAPLPPVLGLCGTAESFDASDLRFPTKYGPLTGRINAATSRYTIPLTPTAHPFPLRDPDFPLQIPPADMKEYFSFCDNFPETVQAYPYAGALMEPFALTGGMFNFLAPADRERIDRELSARLAGACDPERSFDYPVIEHAFFMRTMPNPAKVIELYASPEMPHMKLWNWYDRVEPFTGAKYKIGYLNVGLFSSGVIKTGSREEISNLKIPLIENDWGAGLTFHYILLSALASGNFAPVRENWRLLKEVWNFFDLMHDWACMGTGYSDNAVSWVEGANYGVFTAMPQLAEIVGDGRTLRKALCVSAKQMALRFGLIRSSQHYFFRYYEVEPWHITKFFHNEADPSVAFMNVPKLGFWPGRMREDGVYNLTTEGLYPELFEAFRRFLPEDFKTIREKLRRALHQPREAADNTWGVTEQCCALLICDALSCDRSGKELENELARAEAGGRLMTLWRGIHIFSRILPAGYFKTFIRALHSMRHDPFRPELWSGMRIISASKEASDRVKILIDAVESGAFLRGKALRAVRSVELDGESLPVEERNGSILLRPKHSGTLVIRMEG